MSRSPSLPLPLFPAQPHREGTEPREPAAVAAEAVEMGTEPSDATLAERAASGDREAAGELIARHQGPVRAFLRRLTGQPEIADDLAQETFLRMLRAIDRYDPRYPMRTWLLTIARRLSINRGQKRANQSANLDPEQPDPADRHTPRPDDAAAENDRQQLAREHLQAALQKLTAPQRQAIVLYHQQGLGVEDIARSMNCPNNTVKSHLRRARKALREILAPHQEAIEP